ncbi:zinc transporter 4 isoform X2 [Octodon degus]|uniref:Zinc transporter 4 isoform X2 n=1 Tax=Octodon degus TaxID=10160 RepID=A0A6P6F6I8_OCTDE|nr:zinc transporter 4 isoform X2 [Octodon degus]
MAWTRLRALLLRRGDAAPLFLNDASAFDFADDAGPAGLPRFNKLRVVVAEDDGDTSDRPAVGARSAPQADDDALLEPEPPPPRGRLSLGPDPCDGCSQRRERVRLRRVRTRLTLAAALYLLFMVGELVEVLSAMVSVLLVYVLMGFLLYEAVQRTMHTNYDINGDVMIVTAAVGVAVNLLMGLLLNQSGRHSHSHAPPAGSPGPGSGAHRPGQDSLAVRAAFVHALGDLVQSVGVLIAAYIIRFKPEYKIADPICTYVFSLLMAFTTFRIIWDTVVIILEGVPSHLNVDRIKEALMKIEDVHAVEDLNIWSLTSGKSSAIVHMQLIPGSASRWEEVQSKAKHLLLNTFGLYRCTIQLQSYRQEVARTCASCQSSSP